MSAASARSAQAFMKRIALLVFVLSCFIGRSCGFQVSPAFRKRNKNHKLPLDAANAPFLALVHDSNDAACMSSTALRTIRESSASPFSQHQFESRNVHNSLQSPLFRHSEFRLYAGSSDDDDSPTTSGKLRSFVSKVFKAFARPVRRVTSPIKRVIRWISNKFTKLDEFLEETIEEQENAVAEALADIEARANEIQTKNAAITSEQDMLDQTADTTEDTAEKTQETPTEPAETVKETRPTDDIEAQEKKATAEAQTDIVEKVEAVQTKDAALASENVMLEQLDKTTEETQSKDAAPGSEKDELIAQEQKATAKAQTEIVEKVEDRQTMDAVLATEEGMLAQLDKPEATDADVMTEMKSPPKTRPSSRDKPVGDRWAIATPGVDLSGDWSLIVNDDFKKDYDEYLKQLGQPFIVRSVALTLIGVTTEQTEQKEEGRTLFIRGTNARGIWERTLVTSGADKVNDQFTPLHVPVDTADDERVEAEAWWEGNGTVHRSWMRGLNKYGGGDFESSRYLEEGGKVLVCESIFHPNEKDRKDAGVTWRFLRNGETLDS